MEGAQLAVSVVAINQRSKLVLVPCRYAVPLVPVDTPAAARSSLRIVPPPGYKGQVTDVKAVSIVRMHWFGTCPNTDTELVLDVLEVLSWSWSSKTRQSRSSEEQKTVSSLEPMGHCIALVVERRVVDVVAVMLHGARVTEHTVV